jgi:hypothetical protein
MTKLPTLAEVSMVKVINIHLNKAH